MKVLVVDDNDLIRQSIIKRIDWDALDLCCVGEAADGQEAFEKIEALAPSIVITDVKMPIVDGFYTIDRCRTKHPEVQFIIVSGFDDFPYVKKAVQLNVTNYILKPIDSVELTETLRKARDQVLCYRRDKEERQQTQADRLRYQGQRASNAFSAFFAYKIDYLELQERLGAMEYPLTNPYCACYCINVCLPSGESEHDVTPDDIAGLEREIQALYLHSTCQLLHVYKNIYACVCTFRERVRFSPVQHSRLLAIVTNCFGRQDNARTFLSLSRVTESAKLMSVYQECLRQMMRRFTEPGETLFSAERPALRTAASKSLSQVEQFSVALDLHLTKECAAIIHQMIQHAETSPQTLDNLPELFLLLDDKLEHRLSIREFDQSFRKFYLLRFYNLAQVEHTLHGLLDSIVYAEQDVDIGDKVIAYIEVYFTQQLTLRSLGELFHVNHIYLGQLIKKKTGTLFNTYLNGLRLERAKMLIQTNPAIILKDLSYSLGFMDSHYFTKVFKRNVGMTPTEYRDQALDKQQAP